MNRRVLIALCLVEAVLGVGLVAGTVAAWTASLPAGLIATAITGALVFGVGSGLREEWRDLDRRY